MHTLAAHAQNVGPAEIVTDKKQRTLMLTGDLVRKTVAEVEPGRMHALAPSFVRLDDAPGRRAGDADDLKPKPVQQTLHRLTDSAPPRDDQRFRDRTGRDQQIIGDRKRADASGGFRLVQHDRHQRGGIYGDQCGKPPSS